MDIIAQLVARARSSPRRIVFPEGTDPQILLAASRARTEGIAEPVLIGEPDAVAAAATAAGVSMTGMTVSGIHDEARTTAFAETYAAGRDLKVAVARKLVRKPLAFAGMMVACGHADGMVGGIATATGAVIQAAAVTIGFAPGISTPSSFFIMILPSGKELGVRLMVFADAAVNVRPTPTQLAEIAVAAGRNARLLLGLEPRIAFLSFSTKGSAVHDETRRVCQALELARNLDATLEYDGELQADAAIVPRVAERKAPGSSVAGQANVLVFPDLNSGNIAYKLVQYLGEAQAVGPILQGFAKPVNDLSRGATAADIFGVTAITVLQAAEMAAA